MKEEKLLPVGTRVYSILESEWGVVKEHKTGLYPILIRFESGKEVHYTKEGKVSAGFENPNLSLTEYNFETGGFTPISEYWTKPRVGDWGYFWDYEDINVVFYSQIIKLDDSEYCYNASNGDYFKYFSHEIPPYIKKQMEQ